jgi:hypothetical protein
LQGCTSRLSPAAKGRRPDAPGVLSQNFVDKIAKEQLQILRLTTPKLKSVWGPFPHPSDEDLSPGTPVRSG